MHSRQLDLCQRVPPKISALLWWMTAAISWAAAPVYADLLAQANSCGPQSACVVDTETGIDTPVGPLANAGVIDPISAPPIFGYLGQATAQAGYGHVGTSAELQVSSVSGFPTDIGATGHANASDTLMFSGGTTAQFGFTLHTPTVDLCGLAVPPGGPCDISLARASSSFGAQVKPQYTFATNGVSVGFELDDSMGAVSTDIAGTWNPQTGLLLSAPISLIDPSTGQRVPGVDVLMGSTSFALASGFNPHTPEQITRAAAIFGDTATLTQILVFDARGNLIPDVTINSASGTVYPLAAPVPEPATFLLISFGFGIVGGVVWRRRAMT